jgi:hypothetical protein
MTFAKRSANLIIHGTAKHLQVMAPTSTVETTCLPGSLRVQMAQHILVKSLRTIPVKDVY